MTQRRHFNPDHKRNNATRQNSDVRERKQTDEPLAWKILNSSPTLIFLKDTEGRYLFVNRQFERTFRTRQERIEGKRDDEIFPSQQAAAFRANDLRVLEAGMPMEFEEATVQDDGPHTSIVHRFPLINAEGKLYATGGIGTDITERKRAEQKLRDSEEHYRLLCETAADTVISIDGSGQMVFADPGTDSARQARVRADVGVAFAKRNGLRAILQECAESVARHFDAAVTRIWTVDKDPNLLGLQASAGLLPADLDGTYSNVPIGVFKAGLIAKEQKPLSINDVLNDPRVLDKDWARNHGLIAFAGQPLLVRESLVGVIALFSRTSLTTTTLDALASIAHAIANGIARQRADEAWQSTQAELARAARLTTMAALSASIAHEVTQPLAAIVTNGEACVRLLASNRPNLAETQKAVASIIRDARRAADVVGRVRALLKKSDLDRMPLNLGQVIREVLDLVQPAVTQHRIVLQTSLADDLPLVFGDRIQLQQVVLNLLTNAIEAMRDITDRRREVLISARLHDAGLDAGVVVAVKDTGVGFERANVDQLFEALYTTKPDGLGMGLSISRSTILSHGGHLWATPNAGHGATFQFLLPAWEGKSP